MKIAFFHKRKPMALFIPGLFVLLALLFSSCSLDSTNPPSQATAASTFPPVNGFGSAENHVHSLMAQSDSVLILATHYGIFRSSDGGANWQQVTSGPNQPMQGLMEYSLVASPLNPQRLYVLTLPATIPHAGTLGLYTSADDGKTWQLSIPTASVTSSSIYMVAAGNDTPDEVYIYLPDLGALGLRVSLDDGKHFSSTGTLPFSNILGLIAIPNQPGHLLIYGSGGIASSSDGGTHWQVIKGISGEIYEMHMAGPHTPIYASGDSGIYVSQDDGKTFQLVNQTSYAGLAPSLTQPQVVYGKTGLTVFRSTDGGHTWKALPHISGNLSNLAVDPTNAAQVYLALSYPTAVYLLNSSGTIWTSLTPKI
ncbi:MAG TPA: sialidase family protein [Ktedonobacteraceae bacterium]|nr:sialidase family protein [Ktedonobacteraceae bacterium]